MYTTIKLNDKEYSVIDRIWVLKTLEDGNFDYQDNISQQEEVLIKDFKLKDILKILIEEQIWNVGVESMIDIHHYFADIVMNDSITQWYTLETDDMIITYLWISTDIDEYDENYMAESINDMYQYFCGFKIQSKKFNYYTQIALEFIKSEESDNLYPDILDSIYFINE